MTMPPLVSVVMPAYQAESHIAEAIESMRAQDWTALEIIVVDDGSTDATAQIVVTSAQTVGHPIRLLQQSNRGAGAARDAGIAAAHGDFILLADADDRADPGLVRVLVETITAARADLAFARCRYVNSTGDIVAVQENVPLSPGPIEVLNGFMVNTPLVRRKALKAIGGHDATLRGSIDLDLRLRLAIRRNGAIVANNQVLSDYRRTTGQITSDWRRMAQSWAQVRDKAVIAGLHLSPRANRRMRGRHCVYWSTLAYMAGDYTSARRLMMTAVRLVPCYVAYDPQARIRAASCLVSLLPEPWHARVRTRFNASQAVRA